MFGGNIVRIGAQVPCGIGLGGAPDIRALDVSDDDEISAAGFGHDGAVRQEAGEMILLEKTDVHLHRRSIGGHGIENTEAEGLECFRDPGGMIPVLGPGGVHDRTGQAAQLRIEAYDERTFLPIHGLVKPLSKG